MVRNITPLNDTTPAPEAIPDRSDLAKIYDHTTPANPAAHYAKTDSQHPPTNSYTSTLNFKDTVFINLLLIVPYSLSFLSITAIYSLGPATNPDSALQNRIAMILLTVPALAPWIFSLRTLRNILANYRVRISGLLAIYLIFILPILNITVILQSKHSELLFPLLAATLLLSQVYIWLVVHALQASKIMSIQLITPVILALCLVIVAVLL